VTNVVVKLFKNANCLTLPKIAKVQMVVVNVVLVGEFRKPKLTYI